MLRAHFSSNLVAAGELELDGGFPGEVEVVATEVSVRSSGLVDGVAELEGVHEDTRAQVKVVVDDLQKLFLRKGTSAVRVDVDGEGSSNTDGVGELDEATLCKLGVDDGLCDPASSVGGRAVDLGRVLTRESATTVGAPASVGVDDDLAASEASITVGSTDDEAARGVQVVDGLLVEKLGGDDFLDDVLLELSLDLLVGDTFVVLGGDDDGVDADWDHGAVNILVLDGDLGLAVGAQPCAGAVLADVREALAELVGEHDGQRHELLGLVGGVTEHDTLVTSANVFLGLANVDTLRDIGGLLLDGDEDGAGLVVKALLNGVISDVLDGAADDGFVVDGGLGGDLSEDHDHTGLGASLASDLGVGVLLEAGIQNGV